MTYDFEYLVHLFWCGVTDKVPSLPENEVDWHRLIGLSRQQAVAGVVAYAIKRLVALPESSSFVPTDIIAAERVMLLTSAASTVRRREEALGLLTEFADVGIDVAMIKGFAVADCYAKPETRGSCDIDLLIYPQDMGIAVELLQNNGFTCKRLAKGAYHLVAEHKTLGHLELHIDLLAESHTKAMFIGIEKSDIVQEPYREVVTENGTYRTLGHTDNLIFLIIHLMKHFITSGTNLKMCGDVVRYYQCNESEIDMLRLKLMLDRLHANVLFETLLCMFGEYASGNVSLEGFITDLEACGGMKYDDPNRVVCQDVVEQANMLNEYGIFHYCAYRIKKLVRFVVSIVFIDLQDMKQQYPILDRVTFMLPIMWCYRIFDKGFAYIKKNSIATHIVNEKELPESTKKRVELFRNMEIL